MIEQIQPKLERIQKKDSGKPRKEIVILGAGMAGLTAAYELLCLGHKVTIYEANSSRVGGRAWTHRFDDGQYHEFGAMRFHKEHDHTRHYADLCKLKFRRFINHHDTPDSYYLINGQRVKHKDWATELLPKLDLSDNEKKIIQEELESNKPDKHHKALLSLLAFPLRSTLSEIKRNPFEFNALMGLGPLTPRIIELDNISFGEEIRKHFQTEDAINILGSTTGLESFFDIALTMFLRDTLLAEARLEDQKCKSGLDEIEGGTDLLPKRLADKVIELGGKIEFSHKVTGISNLNDSIRITFENGDKEIEAKHVICTIPFGVLRHLKLTGFSKSKLRAIRNLNYANSAKVLINTKNRFWESQGIIGGGSQTDLINRQVYYPSDNFKGQIKSVSGSGVHCLTQEFESMETNENPMNIPGVIVGSYCWGTDALRLGALSREERGKVVIEAVSQIHPELLETDMVKSPPASISWDEYSNTKGAFCFHKPGDFSNYYFDTLKSEGNLHFAGEHCSLDQGWIQGAIISSLKIVEEIVVK